MMDYLQEHHILAKEVFGVPTYERLLLNSSGAPSIHSGMTPHLLPGTTFGSSLKTTSLKTVIPLGTSWRLLKRKTNS
jgi:hypothetical protein